MSLLIKNGRAIDPLNNLNEEIDLLIDKGKIVKLDKEIKVENHKLIDAKDKIVTPGLIDMHAHLRQPGREDEETILTGAKAGAKGGFTTILAMPNTNPVADNRGIIEFVQSETQRVDLINIIPAGAATLGQKGIQLSEMGELKKAGVLAVSDDGKPISNSETMRRVLEYARMLGLLVISHCEDLNLSAGGVMNEGLVSTILGLRGIPSASESSIVAREISLAKMTRSKIHIAHVSCEESVKLIRGAKAEGVNVTSETCPHYFALTDESVRSFDTNFKMNPPLRTQKDCQAIKEALKDGTIDVIATDHAPHNESEKDLEFDYAPFGIIGLETALGLSINCLVEEGIIELSELIKKMSLNPAKILGLKAGSISVGEKADITIFDPNQEWTVEKETFESKSRNSPFIGWKLKGKVQWTICGGKIVYTAND